MKTLSAVLLVALTSSAFGQLTFSSEASRTIRLYDLVNNSFIVDSQLTNGGLGSTSAYIEGGLTGVAISRGRANLATATLSGAAFAQGTQANVESQAYFESSFSDTLTFQSANPFQLTLDYQMTRLAGALVGETPQMNAILHVVDVESGMTLQTTILDLRSGLTAASVSWQVVPSKAYFIQAVLFGVATSRLGDGTVGTGDVQARVTWNLPNGQGYTSASGVFAPVPEPASIAALAVGVAACLRRRSRRGA